jgi:phosphatidylethanolamine/phosphatidyl-N-methylethanolamine N-methyltransferase
VWCASLGMAAMISGTSLMQAYFDRVYNPIYDFTIAKTSSYHRLQDACIDSLQFRPGDSVLCIGVGTGNEIFGILSRDHRVNVTGADTSGSALRRAWKRASGSREEIRLLRMDAQNLGFADHSFDKVFCHHVMGFLDDDRKATQEMLRVMKDGGQFVVTYPSGSGGVKLIGEVIKSILRSIRSGRCRQALVESLAVTGALLGNIPIAFWVRPNQGFYTCSDLEKLFDGLQSAEYGIENDVVYQDFIVRGRKAIAGP